MINIKSFSCNPFRENSFLVWVEPTDGTGSPADGILIDPGFYDEDELCRLREYMESENVRLQAIWLTHAHFDHIYGVAPLASEYGVPVMMSPDDKEVLCDSAVMPGRFGLKSPDVSFGTVDIKDGDELKCGDAVFKVIATPGHTPGCVCFYDEEDKVLFSGDTLFAGSIGRTDHLGGDYDKEIVSIMDTLMGLPGDVDVVPGHGHRTSIAVERTNNPFLQPFNEPEEDFGQEGLEFDNGIS